MDTTESDNDASRPGRWPRLAAGILTVLLLWWGLGRLSAPFRSVTVRTAGPPVAAPSSTADRDSLRVAAWNIAHGRGDAEGWAQNLLGGGVEARARRLDRIARALIEIDADVVVLNEVDFDAAWSHGVDQARVIAEGAGYRWILEQRSFDLGIPGLSLVSGNAVLSRYPVTAGRILRLPPHSAVEAAFLGRKEAAVASIEIDDRPRVAVVPVHLEPRSEETRLEALPVIEALRRREPLPLILAGDFNSAPPRWPGTTRSGPTIVGELLAAGFGSSRPRPPTPARMTFPTRRYERTIDWILAEPPLVVESVRVVQEPRDLSDHAPVVAELRLPPPDRQGTATLPAGSDRRPVGASPPPPLSR